MTTGVPNGTTASGESGPLADAAGAAARRVVEALPDGVKRRLSGPYNWVQIRRANRAFRAQNRPAVTPSDDAPRHVVVVVVDALRVDAVNPDVTPFLYDRVVGSAVTTAPWTFPAVTSLVTGQYPHEHGAIRQTDRADRGATDLVVPPSLPDDATTLPEVFAAAGYDTYGAFAFHMPFFALGGRFEHHALYDKAPAATVIERFAGWLDAASRERTFSYLHLADLHEPVDPPEEYWQRHGVDAAIPDVQQWAYEDDPEPGPDGERYREHRRRLYRAAVDYVDDRLQALHARVRDRLGPDVAFVVTADHGEGFWEHASFDAKRFVDSRPAYAVDHGGTPYETIARVPLAVDGLDVADLDDVGRPASLVDVAPTLLDALGQPAATASSGHPLTREVPESRVLLVESTRYGHEKKAAYADGWKLLVSRADDEAVGFRLPEEMPADLPADVEGRLYDALPPWPDGTHAERGVSGLARQRLEDLGYV